MLEVEQISRPTDWLVHGQWQNAEEWYVPAYDPRSRSHRAVYFDIAPNVHGRLPNGCPVVHFLPAWAAPLFRETMKRALKKGVPFELTLEGMLRLVWRSKGRCEVSGLAFGFERNSNHYRRPFVPSVDRISSQKGYSLNNCRLVVAIANLAMNEWGEEPLRQLAAAIMLRQNEA